MKKFIIFIILFLVAGILQTSAQTKRSEIANPLNFKKMSVDQKIPDCRKSLLNCGRDVMLALDLLGLGGEDNFVHREEVFTFKNGVGVYVSSIFAKDLTFKQESRTRIAFIKQRNGGYRFVQVGEQFRCLQGKSRGSWSKTRCIADSYTDNSDKENNDKIQKTPLSEVKNLNNFRWLTINGRAVAAASAPCSNNLLECGRERLVIYGYEGFGGEESDNFREDTFTYKEAGKTYGVYLVTMKGEGDDSVAGERVRIGFEKKGRSWEWQQAATQNLCQRGNLAGQWTKERCP
ncbi:MAG: hypothetical protein ACR2MD_01295 [Aridibacter sp.]|jgi:hypothetical protein